MNCQFCYEKPALPIFSFFCSQTCFLLRSTYLSGSINNQPQQQHVVQQKLCQVCHQCPTDPDSNWCSIKCYESGLPGSINYKPRRPIFFGQILCRVCQQPTNSDSGWCSKKCRDSRLPGSANYHPKYIVTHKFCKVCNKRTVSCGSESDWCSKKCRYSRLVGSANYQENLVKNSSVVKNSSTVEKTSTNNIVENPSTDNPSTDNPSTDNPKHIRVQLYHPLCQLCDQIALCHFIHGIPTFKPGCCEFHMNMAKQLGFETARFYFYKC
jgi:predicted nucleic acid-binding Zn ribbon protein